jgi:magnesium chelatase family protein
MLASVRSAMLLGVDGRVVRVEVHVSNGIPGYTVVGLPDAAVRESRERVRAALLSSNFSWPLKRVTVNLAPSALRKSGAGLDLPFALGVMLAAEELPADALEGVGVIGELGLDGSLRPVPGILVLVDALRAAGTSAVLLPAANAAEAALVEGVSILSCTTLTEARARLTGEEPWPPAPDPPSPSTSAEEGHEDLAVVRGLGTGRRALEVAAAGAHHLLMVGPPGAGKTLLAHCLPSILPPLEHEEAIEVARIHSVAGEPMGGSLVRTRPFRAPHHTASTAAMVGGGSGQPRPGEVSLAHRGALFLDELGEFKPTVVDALRQPLEEQVVRISRHQWTLAFPADFLLVACTNPCPCGLGPPGCICNDGLRARYIRRLSAPLLDRFDLRVAVTPACAGDPAGSPSADARERVAEAVARQRARYQRSPWRYNGRVPASALEGAIPLAPDAADALREAAEHRRWSGRGLAKLRRVARTLADLEGSRDIAPVHILIGAGLRADVP